MTSTHTMLTTMMVYQQALNDVFDPAWRVNRHQYLRAASVECSEMQDHYHYKWWKKQESDIGQTKLELVDMAHFLMSEIARLESNSQAAAKVLLRLWDACEPVIVFDSKQYTLSELDVLEKMDLLKGLCCAKRVDFTVFRSIMDDIGMTFEDLYRVYAAKNVLNLFRQRNGYKDGSYVKIWSGREDNVYLSELLETWQEAEGMDALYDRLTDCYRQFAVGE